MPEVIVTREFFKKVDRLGNPPDGFYGSFLKRLGVAKGSKVEELLLKTAAEVTRVANINPFDASLEADAFVRHQEEIQLTKVTEIGRRYGAFLAQLQALGEDIDKFKDLMDIEVRSTVSIVFDQPEGFEVLQQWQNAFSQAATEAFVAGNSEQEKYP